MGAVLRSTHEYDNNTNIRTAVINVTVKNSLPHTHQLTMMDQLHVKGAEILLFQSHPQFFSLSTPPPVLIL